MARPALGSVCSASSPGVRGVLIALVTVTGPAVSGPSAEINPLYHDERYQVGTQDRGSERRGRTRRLEAIIRVMIMMFIAKLET